MLAAFSNRFSVPRDEPPITSLLPIAGIIVAIIINAGCTRATNAASTPPPLQVQVVQVEQKDVPIYREWIGTLDGLVNADIKAEVSGYLTQQAYTEGTFVRKGQLLFQIDPRPFQSVLDQAQGQLAQAQGQSAQAQAQLTQAEAQLSVAQANQRRSQLDEDRYIPLAQQRAITQQDLDNATQNNQAAKAQVQSASAQIETARAQIIAANANVQAARATVETAQINLGFTHITSPIDGIPGIAQLQVGSLVSPASGAITTVSTLNPIKSYITVSEQEYLDLNRRFPQDEARQEHLREVVLELTLADGSAYPYKGKFFFADRQVDVRTGAIRMAGLFPNPENYLRPGQYGKIRVAIGTQKGALLVPQQAVIDLQGTHQVAVLESGNKIRIQPVSLGETIGNQWIVQTGLKPGESVVAEGLQKVRQGMQVDPKPFTAR
jgi:membrane fusion protein (multidrug efflux system)